MLRLGGERCEDDAASEHRHEGAPLHRLITVHPGRLVGSRHEVKGLHLCKLSSGSVPRVLRLGEARELMFLEMDEGSMSRYPATRLSLTERLVTAQTISWI